MYCLNFVHVIIEKKSLASNETKTNHTACNWFTVLTVLADNKSFMRTENVFMTQCLIDGIFVEIKMMPSSVKFRNLESPYTLKLCLKREKRILFRGEICLLMTVILSKSKVLVTFSKKRPSWTLISCLH